jgi:hypothetical protein
MSISFRSQAGKNNSFTYTPFFRPEQVGNLTIWLNMDSDSAIFDSSGDLTEWRDKLRYVPPNKDDPAQGLYIPGLSKRSPTLTTFGNGNGAQFGPTNYMKSQTNVTLTTSDSCTIFIVGFFADEEDSTQNIFSFAGTALTPGSTNAECRLYYDSVSIPPQTNGTFDVTGLATTSSTIVNTPGVLIFSISAGVGPQTIYINADSTTSGTISRDGIESLNGGKSIYIGHSDPAIFDFPFSGTIAEILVYDSVVAIDKVTAYLGQKWGFGTQIFGAFADKRVFYPIRSGPIFTFNPRVP